MELDGRADGLRDLLQFHEVIIEDILESILKRVEILESLLSMDPSLAASVFPYLFPRYFRESTLEVVKVWNSEIVKEVFDKD
jgi:hypothetical protein